MLPFFQSLSVAGRQTFVCVFSFINYIFQTQTKTLRRMAKQKIINKNIRNFKHEERLA